MMMLAAAAGVPVASAEELHAARTRDRVETRLLPHQDAIVAHFAGQLANDFRWLSLQQALSTQVSFGAAPPPGPGLPPAPPAPPTREARVDEAQAQLFSRLGGGDVGDTALLVVSSFDLGQLSAMSFERMTALNPAFAKESALLLLRRLIGAELDDGAEPSRYVPAADGAAGVMNVFDEVLRRAKASAATVSATSPAGAAAGGAAQQP